MESASLTLPGAARKTIIVVDGESKATFPSVLAGPVFSPDSQRIALVVAESGALSLVVDDAKVGPASTIQTDFIVDLMFSPDNRRVAYIGVNGGDWYDPGYTVRARRRVYVDGEPGTEYDVPFLGGLQFTTESYHFVYMVGRLSEGSRHVSFVVVDGTEGKRYDDIFGAPRFENDGVLSYTAQAGRKFFKVTQRLGTQPPTL